MEAYIPSLYSEDVDFEIYFRENALEYKKAEAACLDVLMVYEDVDSESEKPGMFEKLNEKVKALLNRIREIISNFIGAVKSAFSGGTLTVQDYMQSNTVKVKLSADAKKIADQVEQDILSERKGVQMISKAVKSISSKTGMPLDSFFDEKTIGGIIDKTNAFMVNSGGTVVSAAAATVIGNALYSNLDIGQKLTKELEESRATLEVQRKNKQLTKTKYYEENNKKLMLFITKLSGKIMNTVTTAEKTYADVTKPIKTFKKTATKFEKKKKKK